MRRAVLLALLLVGCGKAAPKEEAPDAPATVAVDMATVATGDVEDSLTVDGSLVPPEGASSRLAPSAAGRLVEVRVKEGDRVRKGQLLARVDARALVAAGQSAAAGAASSAATAAQSELAFRAAQADQASAVVAARLALDVALADAKSSVDQAAVELQRLRAGARPQEIAQAQQTVDQASIARDKARLDADRDARLLKEGLVAGSQADASKAAAETAESALRSARASLDLVQAGSRPEDVRAAELRLGAARDLSGKRVAQARATLAQAQAGRLGIAAKAEEAAASRLASQQKEADARAAAAAVAIAEMRSPLDGVVVKRYLNVGDVADTTTPVLAVAASSARSDFVGSVSPAEAARVAPGMRVKVGGLGGVVTSVGAADPMTGLVAIRARLSGAAASGGFATARIVLSTLRGVATVPKGAVLSREGKDVVFVVKDGVAHMTDVTLGPETEDAVAVRKGLTKGEKVVLLGGNELSDGAKVEAAKEP